MSYQPPTGYYQHYNYPPPNYYFPPPNTGRPRNETMKAIAIILFVVGFFLNVIALVPFFGFFFGLFGLLCDLIGFVCVCLI